MAANPNFFRLLSLPVTLTILAWLLFSFMIAEVALPVQDKMDVTMSVYSSVFVFSALPYFLTRYWLVPQYLFKRKFFLLLLLTILVILISGAICYLGSRYTANFFQPDFPVIPKDGSIQHSLHLFWWNAILGVFASGSIMIYFDRRSIEMQVKNVQNEKISTELAFLRGQINPHFLISVMNTLKENIKNEDQSVRESVSTFTDLLHYQLFECTHDEILIEREINYIRSYIMVQSNRLEEGSDIRVQTTGDLTGFYIAPLLILPLIENAFKHISHYNESNKNLIHINIEYNSNHKLIISVSNSYETTSASKQLMRAGGIGLVNLKRRLELLYNGRYGFKTEEKNGVFTAVLSLNILTD